MDLIFFLSSKEDHLNENNDLKKTQSTLLVSIVLE
jgi:hypothetical protein